ncbi:MAG: SPOR domain-containing protein [Rhizomicrobium sp.]
MARVHRIGGCLFGLAIVATAPQTSHAAVDASDALHASTPAQMLDLANQALAAGQLSAPDKARILLRRGLAREMLGQRNDALADFNEAISSSALSTEEQASALYDRGVTLDELNRTDDAIADYTAALKLVPKLAAALNNRANALRRVGRLAEAERDYEASMDAGNPHPEYPEYGMGQIAETLGQPNAAREYYRSALAANPQFTLASDRLAALDAGSAASPASSPVVLTKPDRPDPPAESRPASAAIAGAAPVLKPAISETAATGNRSVQLGAYRSEAEANDAWTHLQKNAGAMLAALTPLIGPTDLPGKGRWYRLRIGQLDVAAANQLCASLKGKGIACILVPD